MELHYFRYSQIKQQFDRMSAENKVTTLVTALEIKEINPTKTKEVCIAMALGYKACISGSGFFEKVNN